MDKHLELEKQREIEQHLYERFVQSRAILQAARLESDAVLVSWAASFDKLKQMMRDL